MLLIIDKYLIILQSLLLRSESSARFEGIYEESRAVFLCNEGEGHTGAKQRIPIPIFRLARMLCLIIDYKWQGSLFISEMIVTRKTTWDCARFRWCDDDLLVFLFLSFWFVNDHTCHPVHPECGAFKIYCSSNFLYVKASRLRFGLTGATKYFFK